jgi:ribA/ribD-fused uncharacterized protein
MEKIVMGSRFLDDMVTFFGSQSPFSNFHPAPFRWKGYVVKTSEHAFMLEKALMFEPSKARAVVNARTPQEVKRIGRAIQNFDSVKWDENRYGIMVEILKAKFAPAHLRAFLMSTGNRELVEGSPYDGIWGVKLDWKSDEIRNRNNWRGKNLLGRALMAVREHYRNQ